MANQTGYGPYPESLVDLGDGTYAPKVYPVAATDITAPTATLSNLASAATSAQALAANTSRKGVTMYNDDAYGVYIKYGTTASATSYTVFIGANGYWEMPDPIYTGRIDAIWAGDGSGSLRITELA